MYMLAKPVLLYNRYDFHRGIDIPTPEGTPVYAIANASVRIAGSDPHYSDLLVQVCSITLYTLYTL